MAAAFEEIIWQILASIPAGKVATYGQLAALAGFPNHARRVGVVLKNLPKDTTLPWHRVVNAQGKLSFPVDSEPYNIQANALKQEGVVFHRHKITLHKYQWCSLR